MSETFGGRLRSAMQQKNWQQVDLARAAGVDESLVSRHLERAKAPRPDSVEKYCRVLGVSYSWLVYGREETPRVALLGSAALERVLAAYEWPDVDIETVDLVCSDVRAEASAKGQDRPESVWRLRITQLLRERTGRAKDVHDRPAEPVDLEHESPEIQRARKKSKKF